MSFKNPSDAIAVVGVINPQSASAGTVVSGVVDLSKFKRYQFIVQTGTLGSSATVDAKITVATSSGGSYVDLDSTNAAITQLVKATDDNKLAIMELNVANLNQTSSDYTHAKLSITVGTAASQISGLVVGYDPHYGPAFNHDIAAVAQIKSY